MLRSERLLEPARLEPACAAHAPVEGRLVPTLATELAELAGSAERSAAPCAQRCRQIHAILHPRTAAGPCGRLPERTGRRRGARKRRGGSPGPGQRAVRRGRRGHPCRRRSRRDRRGCVRRRRHGSLRDAARRCWLERRRDRARSGCKGGAQHLRRRLGRCGFCCDAGSALARCPDSGGGRLRCECRMTSAAELKQAASNAPPRAQ